MFVIPFDTTYIGSPPSQVYEVGQALGYVCRVLADFTNYNKVRLSTCLEVFANHSSNILVQYINNNTWINLVGVSIDQQHLPTIRQNASAWIIIPDEIKIESLTLRLATENPIGLVGSPIILNTQLEVSR